MADTGSRARSWCIHYRPPTEAFACGAGVNWSFLSDIPSNERPCQLTAALTPRPGTRDCAHRRVPITLKGEMNAEFWSAKFATVAAVVAVVGDVRKAHRGKHVALIAQCPICKGSLHVTTFPNGGATGKCETRDCANVVMRPV